MKLTMAQALVKFLDNQYISFDGVETKFVDGIFGIFGHGCVVGIGQALEQGGHNLKFYQGHNEQGMAHAAMAFAKQKNRRQIIACTSSIGPGALNMVTAAGTATANRIPLLLLPGDTFACRQPDPVLQQIEQPSNYTITANDSFKAVCKYWDRISRPEQLMTACLNAMRVLTDPAETGAVCLAMPQDVEGEAFDYPDYFLNKRVWYLDRRSPSQREIAAAVDAIMKSEKPLLIVGGGVTYSEAWETAQFFAEKFNIPIGETQAGKGNIRWDLPLNMGGIGVTGGPAANILSKQADLIIAVGTRLTDFTTASKWGFQNPDVKMLQSMFVHSMHSKWMQYRLSLTQKPLCLILWVHFQQKIIIQSGTITNFARLKKNILQRLTVATASILKKVFHRQEHLAKSTDLLIKTLLQSVLQEAFPDACRDSGVHQYLKHTIWNTVSHVWVMKSAAHSA